jgi:hypothetical protein
MMKTLLPWAVTLKQVEVKFMFGQDHDTLRILVMSIIHLKSLWIEDSRSNSCEQELYTNYHFSPLLHGSDASVGGTDQ